MKTDRLIGILSILLQEEKTTAPELAEKFEVSRRTINRDIEDLCKAGNASYILHKVSQRRNEPKSTAICHGTFQYHNHIEPLHSRFT